MCALIWLITKMNWVTCGILSPQLLSFVRLFTFRDTAILSAVLISQSMDENGGKLE